MGELLRYIPIAVGLVAVVGIWLFFRRFSPRLYQGEGYELSLYYQWRAVSELKPKVLEKLEQHLLLSVDALTNSPLDEMGRWVRGSDWMHLFRCEHDITNKNAGGILQQVFRPDLGDFIEADYLFRDEDSALDAQWLASIKGGLISVDNWEFTKGKGRKYITVRASLYISEGRNYLLVYAHRGAPLFGHCSAMIPQGWHFLTQSFVGGLRVATPQAS